MSRHAHTQPARRFVDGTCFAAVPGMANLSSQPPESLSDLLRSIADQAQTFIRAEVALIKLEAQRTVTSAIIALLVLVASGILLAIALSLVAAGLVVLRGGSAAAALLTAAGVDLIVAVVSSVVAVNWARKRAESTAAEASQLTNVPQHGSSLS
jgi:hypothetical protein